MSVLKLDLTRTGVALALLALTGAVACKKEQPTAQQPPAQSPPVAPARVSAVRVTEIQLGNALGEDKRPKAQATSFAKTDTVFASVITEGAAQAAELTARWTYQDGQVVNETKRTIAPGAVAVTEFSIQKPSGWPPGDYKVEVSVDGQPAQSKTFKIQ